MEFCVLEPVEPPQRMERSDGCIRNVYMQGWMTMGHYEVYSDFLANVPEEHLRELETALGRRVRESLCSDRCPESWTTPASSRATSTRTAGRGARGASRAPDSSSAGAQDRSRRGP